MDRQLATLKTAQACGRGMVNAPCAQGRLRRLHRGAGLIHRRSNLPRTARRSQPVSTLSATV